MPYFTLDIRSSENRGLIENPHSHHRWAIMFIQPQFVKGGKIDYRHATMLASTPHESSALLIERACSFYAAACEGEQLTNSPEEMRRLIRDLNSSNLTDEREMLAVGTPLFSLPSNKPKV